MQDDLKLRYLQSFELFEDVPERSLKALAAHAGLRTVGKKEIVSFPHNYTKFIHFLTSGHIKIYRLADDGQQAIIDVIGPGEIFGDLPYDEMSDDCVEFAEALDCGLICSIRLDDFLLFLQEHPKVNRRLFKWMVYKFRRIESRLEDLIFKDARRRIYSFIKQYAEDFGKYHKGRIVMSQFLSQKEIAHITATSRQTVASILNDLRRDGILEFTRSSMTICRPEELS